MHASAVGQPFDLLEIGVTRPGDAGHQPSQNMSAPRVTDSR